ncbi:MAG TPA: hypothetical protein VKF37_09150 [Chloroflexota bacterium]|nr:hypothetical protein [Chloroflexota bacterium]
MHTNASHAYAQLLADVTVLQKTHLGASPATHPVLRAKELIRRVTQEPGIWRDLARDVADPEAALGVVVWACVRAADDDATGVAALRSQPLLSLAALPEPPETPRDAHRRAADGPCTPSWTSEEARRRG